MNNPKATEVLKNSLRPLVDKVIAIEQRQDEIVAALVGKIDSNELHVIQSLLNGTVDLNEWFDTL